MNVFEKYTKVAIAFNTMSDDLKAVIQELRDLRSINDRLRLILGEIIPVEELAKIEDEDMPQCNVSDEEFIKRLTDSYCGRTMPERMDLLQKLTAAVKTDLDGFSRKFEKMTNAMDKLDANTSEFAVYVKKRSVVGKTVKALRHRLVHIARAWVAIRHRHLNRIYGMSEMFFKTLGEIDGIESLLMKKPIDGICKGIVDLDAKIIKGKGKRNG